MTREQEFTIFVLEIYRRARNLTGREAHQLFEKHDIFAAITDNYLLWHIESPENFIVEIDALCSR